MLKLSRRLTVGSRNGDVAHLKMSRVSFPKQRSDCGKPVNKVVSLVLEE
jgi:hypothetical protein